ncbi:TolC family protein [Brevundimonas variabilis]|uniref:Cobalt-zinc-cadmium efflux system outer membrane protein n=1 Tax=Brevundimonas variabilis TaxID=74312 RepID=A0A7W9FDW7_9CAUL|nr:cobalt-zinc-cadmium efflux system outer membrane protein [Brevundimonas variabilis]
MSGCATVDPTQDTIEINRLLADRGAPKLGWEANAAPEDEATVQRWLGQPMSADLAVRMAMVRSPQLQEQYAELGLARADVLEAIQIANPRIGASRLSLEDGGGEQLTYGLSAPLIDLLVLPSRVRLARLENQRARYQIAAAVLDVSLDVEAAWYTYVGAQQVADMRAAVAEALGVSADLSQRYFDAGNITELQLNRELAAASSARIDAARAAVEARMARLDLNTLIGLRGTDTDWSAGTVLPLPVAAEDDPTELRRMAETSSLELLAARQEAEITASAAGVTRNFRLLGDTSIGFEREEEIDGSRISGPTLDLELPIFNQGQARVARADAQLRLARARLARIELLSGNGIDLAAERVRVLSDIVRIHRDALVPQREIVTVRSQEEQNFMLIGVFDVIQAKTQEYDAYQSYLESVRDYWLARIALMRLVGARLPSEREVSEQTDSVSDILATPTSSATPIGASTVDHSQHGGQGGIAPATAPASTPTVDHSQHNGGRA